MDTYEEALVERMLDLNIEPGVERPQWMANRKTVCLTCLMSQTVDGKSTCNHKKGRVKGDLFSFL